MAKMPPIHELEFIRIFNNHNELSTKLAKLLIPSDDIGEYARHVTACWFKLAQEHMEEAEKAFAAGSDRSSYSRAYYAAYNASKAVRYLVSGAVSLKGDDHRRAGLDLPNDFPDVAVWGQRFVMLLEHRQRADYDNWADSKALNTISPRDAVDLAKAFIELARNYLNGKYGTAL